MIQLIDSHCHLHLMGLETVAAIQTVLDHAKAQGVMRCLCVAVSLQDEAILKRIAHQFKQVFISVGEHPCHVTAPLETGDPSSRFGVNDLVRMADFSACIAIGETGLDYFRVTTSEAKQQQRDRFQMHIEAARLCKKPLIIHTREAAKDTFMILKQTSAQIIGGVMHCFTGSYAEAKKALDLGFYISFSGIITFHNATDLQAVAKKVPLDRILIETDAPYLAPIPFRGKQNQPAYVYQVAAMLAHLRNEPLEQIAQATTANFERCFHYA